MNEILAKLYGLERRGIAPGLDRMQWMLERLGNPHHLLNCIHVAGTNGKGTVSSVIASILTEYLSAQDRKVGLFTSPHIQSFTERIRVNGQAITVEECLRLFHTIEPLVDTINATFFEVTTTMALLKFREVDNAVLEVGLGGRLDATNVVIPRVSVITKIDFDHREWLGDTLEAIAREKAGIMKGNVPALIGESRDELRPVFYEVAEHVGVASCIFLDDLLQACHTTEHSLLGMTTDISVGRWKFDRLFVPLHGVHQARNVAIALAALQQYWNVDPPNYRDLIERGLRNLQSNSGLRARIEVVCHDPLIVLDVAHNPDGCGALARVISEHPFPGQWEVIFGVMHDKDYLAMINALAPITRKFYFASPCSHRARDARSLVAAAESCNAMSTFHQSVSDALRTALHTNRPIVCLGSFVVIQEALEVLEEYGIVTKYPQQESICL